ncbi:MAG: hypothetical protein IJX52_05270 [Oscillibacter sp.]|nr:hypothetical protein [Oscillibacter sp.]
MQDAISLFIHQRLDAIMEDLRANNAEYALASERQKLLYGQLLDPVLRGEGPLTLSPGDRAALRDYLEQEFVTNAVAEEVLYRQGFLDCIRLLRHLGV